MQERELPHLPTNLLVQEQDSVLAQVNDRLSHCAFDFVAKYQFPIPLTQDMRPVSHMTQHTPYTQTSRGTLKTATPRRSPSIIVVYRD
jgi:hypothetical protein